jgi:hypothetical protein
MLAPGIHETLDSFSSEREREENAYKSHYETPNF